MRLIIVFLLKTKKDKSISALRGLLQELGGQLQDEQMREAAGGLASEVRMALTLSSSAGIMKRLVPEYLG